LARTLSQFSLFSGLDDQARRQIAAHVQVRTFAPGQIIAFEDEPARAVYLVARGRARVYRLSLEGREWTLHYVGPGESLNLSPVLDGGVNLATVEATTHTTVCIVLADRFRQIVRDHPQVAAAALQCLADTVRHLSDTAENLALHTVRTRLARFLLSCTSNDARSSRYWTHEEIAAHIGTVRDVVGRTLRSFSREGLIRRERRRLVVTDWAGVEREAMANAN
jgi:CRP/FNR family transcriptional regulator